VGRLVLAAVITSLLGMASSNSALASCSALIKPSLLSEPLPPSLQPSDAALSEGEPDDSSVIKEPGSCVIPGTVGDSETTCQKEPTLPSLWWAQDQYGGKLLFRWLASPRQANEAHRVDVIVNPQLWSSLGYVDRYKFVTQFGSASSQFGYNSRIFDRRGTCLAAYTCAYDNTGKPSICQTLLPILGRSNLF